MRLLGHLPDEKLARRFADYLSVQSMASQVEPEADGRWAVWVHDDDHLDAAATELASFHTRPEDQKYVSAAADAAKLREQEEKDEQARAKRTFDRGRLLEKSWLQRFGICTASFILLSVVVFAVQLANEALVWNWLGIVTLRPEEGGRLAWLEVGFLPEVRSGQLWRLVTPIIVHGGPIHLLMNMLLFAQLGSAIEMRYGWNRLLVLILIVAAFSNLLEYLFTSPAFCGMSGVVFGLFGFIWTQWKYHPNSGFVVPPNLTLLMLFWFVFCIVGLGGTIANFVHWGGLASGALIGYVTAMLSRPR
jgi:GlpG protein